MLLTVFVFFLVLMIVSVVWCVRAHRVAHAVEETPH